MTKLAIIITHPIQYYVPLFQLLAQNCDLKVFYTWGEKGIGEKFDPDFNRKISWDIPLLEGYKYEVLKNVADDQGSHHFKGIVNPELITRIKEFNPDKLLVYGWSYSSHLKTLRYFKSKIPIYFRGDSNLLDAQSSLKKTIRSLFLRWVYSHIDKALYVGKANKLYYEKFGLKANQLIFVPHAIDNARFAENRAIESDELRLQLAIKADDILILFAGKLETKKDPETLLNAFTAINRTDIHLLFVGNGELKQSLESKVEKDACHPLSMTNRVHFMDFQNQTQMPVIYQACDLFCLPSKGPGETWGLAVNEAMAASKAVLVSDKVGCHLDLVESANGFTFKAGNEEDLFSVLKSLEKKDLFYKGIASKEKIKQFSYQVSLEIFKKNIL